MLTLSRRELASEVKPRRSAEALSYRAWVARAPKQPLVFDKSDLGPLGAEEVEVAVEHCGLCHSDLSVLTTLARAELGIPASDESDRHNKGSL